jgi:hypothetical protein
MFKKKSAPAQTNLRSLWFRLGSLFVLLFLVLALTACRTLPALPRANLSSPGWKVHQGQAVWRADRGAPEIAGEILVATNLTGEAFVQFTKTPFPFVIARTTTNSWQIESPSQNRRYSGPGLPPQRLIWLQLPRAYSGLLLSPRWSWQILQDGWRLENLSTGESLEGYFTQ